MNILAELLFIFGHKLSKKFLLERKHLHLSFDESKPDLASS